MTVSLFSDAVVGPSGVLAVPVSELTTADDLELCLFRALSLPDSISDPFELCSLRSVVDLKLCQLGVRGAWLFGWAWLAGMVVLVGVVGLLAYVAGSDLLACWLDLLVWFVLA